MRRGITEGGVYCRFLERYDKRRGGARFYRRKWTYCLIDSQAERSCRSPFVSKPEAFIWLATIRIMTPPSRDPRRESL